MKRCPTLRSGRITIGLGMRELILVPVALTGLSSRGTAMWRTYSVTCSGTSLAVEAVVWAVASSMRSLAEEDMRGRAADMVLREEATSGMTLR